MRYSFDFRQGCSFQILKMSLFINMQKFPEELCNFPKAWWYETTCAMVVPNNMCQMVLFKNYGQRKMKGLSVCILSPAQSCVDYS